jgi:uncharacterized membrane protein YgdD (TMEM256/DUF423 family)
MFKNLIITCFIGMLAVVFGAFGAHALKESLTIDQLSSFETAVRYQMYHVIVLLFVNTFSHFSEKDKNQISYLFFLGIILFSGSIYLIQIVKISVKTIWFVTPLGGLFLIFGWALIIFKLIKKTSK